MQSQIITISSNHSNHVVTGASGDAIGTITTSIGTPEADGGLPDKGHRVIRDGTPKFDHLKPLRSPKVRSASDGEVGARRRTPISRNRHHHLRQDQRRESRRMETVIPQLCIPDGETTSSVSSLEGDDSLDDNASGVVGLNYDIDAGTSYYDDDIDDYIGVINAAFQRYDLNVSSRRGPAESCTSDHVRMLIAACNGLADSNLSRFDASRPVRTEGNRGPGDSIPSLPSSTEWPAHRSSTFLPDSDDRFQATTNRRSIDPPSAPSPSTKKQLCSEISISETSATCASSARLTLTHTLPQLSPHPTTATQTPPWPNRRQQRELRWSSESSSEFLTRDCQLVQAAYERASFHRKKRDAENGSDHDDTGRRITEA